MMKHLCALLILAACGSSHPGLPEVPAGAYEAECTSLCNAPAEATVCTVEMGAYCLASCRAHTLGAPDACGTCLLDGATASEQRDEACLLGEVNGISSCVEACAGATPIDPEMAYLCDLQCDFQYNTFDGLSECSGSDTSKCHSDCRALVAGQSRTCAQCVIDNASTFATCINGACDCGSDFNLAVCDSVCD